MVTARGLAALGLRRSDGRVHGATATGSGSESGFLGSGRASPWWLAAGFLLFGLVWLSSEGSYHGDERFYTDAALRMIASGDWLRPEYADGSARVNKPLLVYWLIGASMQTFGATLFAARLPFLVAGAFVIVVTARLARALYGEDRRVPWLAAVIAASNVSLVTLAVRSTPDVLVVLTVAVALTGLAQLLVEKRAPRACAPWLWLGIGGAAAAKGSLALVVLLFAVAAITRVRRDAWPALLRSPWMFVAALAAAASLAPLALADAAADKPSFVQDQVTSRLAASWLDAIVLAATYAGSIARHFLPWILIPVVALVFARGQLAAWVAPRRRALTFSAAFVVVVLVVFSVANTHRGRYLAPVYPVLAAALAVVVAQAQDRPLVGGVLRALTGVAAVAALLVTWVVARADVAAGISACVAAAIAVACWTRTRPGERAPAFAIATSCLVLLAVPTLRHVFRSDHWEQAASAPRVDATWGIDPVTPSIVRILSHGRLDPRPWPSEPDVEAFERDEVVLVAGPESAEIERHGWRLEPCGSRAPSIRVSEIDDLLAAPDARAWFLSRGKPVCLARRIAGERSR